MGVVYDGKANRIVYRAHAESDAMSEFKILINKSRESGEQLKQVARNLSTGASDIQSVKANLGFEISSRAQIEDRLKTIAEQLEKESKRSNAVGLALDIIIKEYELSENKLCSASVSNGHIDSDGKYFYHKENGENVTNAYRQYVYDGKTMKRYFGADGKMVTGLALINGVYKYFCEMQGTPTYGVQASKKDVIDYILSGKSFDELARYQPMDRFLDGLTTLEEMEYSLSASKKTLFMMVQNWFDPDSSPEHLADLYMNNEEECKKMLMKIVDSASDNSYTKLIPSDQYDFTKLLDSAAADTIQATLGKEYSDIYKDHFDIFSLLSAMENGNELLSAAQTKYEKNIAILETLRKSVPADSTMARCINSSMREYQHKAEYAVKDLMANLQPLFRGEEGKAMSKIMKLESKQGLADLLVETGLEQMMGKTFVKGFDYTEKILEQDPKVGALNNIIYGSGTVNYSMDALRNAQNELQAAYQTGDQSAIDSALSNYSNCFGLAKTAKASQYKEMRDFYSGFFFGDSDKYTYYDQEMKELNKAPMFRCA